MGYMAKQMIWDIWVCPQKRIVSRDIPPHTSAYASMGGGISLAPWLCITKKW